MKPRREIFSHKCLLVANYLVCGSLQFRKVFGIPFLNTGASHHSVLLAQFPKFVIYQIVNLGSF